MLLSVLTCVRIASKIVKVDWRPRLSWTWSERIYKPVTCPLSSFFLAIKSKRIPRKPPSSQKSTIDTQSPLYKADHNQFHHAAHSLHDPPTHIGLHEPISRHRSTGTAFPAHNALPTYRKHLLKIPANQVPPQTTEPPHSIPCGGISNPRCARGQYCVPDPRQNCPNPTKCPHICVYLGDQCGGFTGKPCEESDAVCIDDPRDDCTPPQGADCAGSCVKLNGTPPGNWA